MLYLRPRVEWSVRARAAVASEGRAMVLIALTLLTSGMTMLVMWALGSHQRWGWLVLLANQVNWMTFIALTRAWGLIPLQIFMIILAIRGWRNWKIS